MGMTEKQGGSDLRANTTVARAVGEGLGPSYALTGHKWFMSAPVIDVFFVVAHTPAASPASSCRASRLGSSTACGCSA